MARTHVSYGESSLIPAPFVTFNRVFTRTNTNELIGSLFKITITGKLVSYKGSPNSSGIFWTGSNYPSDENISMDGMLGAILRKQQALRNLFSQDGLTLTFQSADGSAPLTCNPIIDSVTFSDDIWIYTCDYTIECSCTKMNGIVEGSSNAAYLSEANESWQIEVLETPTGIEAENQRIYRISHTLSASSKDYPDNDTALNNAKDWVQSRLGFEPAVATDSVVGVSGDTYNYVREEVTNKKDGQYSVTETWIVANDIATEVFTVRTQQSIDTGITTVGIEGTVTGFQECDTDAQITTTKYENAVKKYKDVKTEILSRAQTYGNVTLNSQPLNYNEAFNPIDGIITYSYEYNNRPSNIISGARSEVISINDSLNTNIVAIVPVLGRTAGPVLQDINTSREKSRTLNVEVVLDGVPTNTFTNPLISLLEPLVTQISPAQAFGASQFYLVDNNYTWDPKTNRGTCTKVWVYEL
jgi:hypothetical protein